MKWEEVEIKKDDGHTVARRTFEVQGIRFHMGTNSASGLPEIHEVVDNGKIRVHAIRWDDLFCDFIKEFLINHLIAIHEME